MTSSEPQPCGGKSPCWSRATWNAGWRRSKRRWRRVMATAARPWSQSCAASKAKRATDGAGPKRLSEEGNRWRWAQAALVIADAPMSPTRVAEGRAMLAEQNRRQRDWPRVALLEAKLDE